MSCWSILRTVCWNALLHSSEPHLITGLCCRNWLKDDAWRDGRTSIHYRDPIFCSLIIWTYSCRRAGNLSRSVRSCWRQVVQCMVSPGPSSHGHRHGRAMLDTGRSIFRRGHSIRISCLDISLGRARKCWGIVAVVWMNFLVSKRPWKVSRVAAKYQVSIP